MKRFILLALMVVCATAISAQELPYGKILNYSTTDFAQGKYKFNEDYNSWHLGKHNGLQATANVLSALAGTSPDIRPNMKDYDITVQLSREGRIAFVKVVFYNEETHHKLLTFVADHGVNVLETKSGHTTKIQFEAAGYALSLEQINHNSQAVRTNTYHAAKVLDDSYSTFIYTIYTDEEPWSKEIERQQRKAAKRDAKGKKKRDVSDLM